MLLQYAASYRRASYETPSGMPIRPSPGEEVMARYSENRESTVYVLQPTSTLPDTSCILYEAAVLGPANTAYPPYHLCVLRGCISSMFSTFSI